MESIGMRVIRDDDADIHKTWNFFLIRPFCSSANSASIVVENFFLMFCLLDKSRSIFSNRSISTLEALLHMTRTQKSNWAWNERHINELLNSFVWKILVNRSFNMRVDRREISEKFPIDLKLRVRLEFTGLSMLNGIIQVKLSSGS